MQTYPEFREIYEEGYEICRNVERVMEMFSKELYELDRNTVQYMIDEMQDTIDAQRDELNKQNQTIKELQELHEEHEKMLYGAVSILRGLSIPEHEIITRICDQYQISEEQVRKYL